MRRKRLIVFGSGIIAILAAGCATSFERQLGSMVEYQRFFQGSQEYILCSSANDWILKLVGITNPVGSSRGLAKAKKRPEQFQVVQMKNEAPWTSKPSSNPCQLVVLDASEAISGHQDVYSAVVGQLMWEATRAFTPASSWSDTSRQCTGVTLYCRTLTEI